MNDTLFNQFQSMLEGQINQLKERTEKCNFRSILKGFKTIDINAENIIKFMTSNKAKHTFTEQQLKKYTQIKESIPDILKQDLLDNCCKS